MFNDEILEKIFSHPQTSQISIYDLSIMIKIIEEVLQQSEVENAISKY